MPKRRNDDHHYDDLCKKLRKIEKEIQREKKCRRRRVRVLSSSSSSSSSSQDYSARQSEPKDSAPQSPVHVESLPQDMVPPMTAACQTNVDALEVTPSTPTKPDSDPAQEDIAPSELDTETMEILGVDPTKTKVFGKHVQNDVAVRFEHIATTGLTKEDRKELTDKYLVPENCNLVGAPALNPEIKAALSEMVLKRDKVIETKQTLMSSAISSLGQAITLLLSSKEKNTDLLRLLMDTGRTLSDCQHNDTVTRRNFILYAVKKEMKESLQNAKVDNFLFGEQLTDTLKVAKVINKAGADLKAPPPPKPTTSGRNMPSKNWKSFNPVRKNASTKKDTTTSNPTTSSTPATRNLRPNSYRQSQSQRAAYKRRR